MSNQLSDAADLTESLMRIDSTSGREGAAIAWLDDALRTAGWRTTRIPVTEGRDALYARSVDATCPVTLSTHIDTVPPFIAPRREHGTLFGRGACDAKGIAASMIVAAERLRARGEAVGLLFVVGEEVTHDGAHAANAWAARHQPGSRFLINGEPTESTLAVGTKGASRLIVRTEGKAAHSAYPHLGRSATTALVKLLAELDSLELPRDELLGETTVNIGSISGGVADNVMAPSAEARLMMRLVTPLETVQPIFERWASGRADLEWSVTVPPVRLGVLDGFPTSVAAFATDIPELTNWGMPYLFGPGSIHVAHTDNEHVNIDELAGAADAYERLAGQLLGVVGREVGLA
jgi:acetylornithine deacetylase